MTITFRPARRAQTPVVAGIAGISRTGKTYSGLRLATGLAEGSPIALIDTESSRGLQYAERFKYMHADLTAPFTCERYLEAIEAAKAAGAKVIIVDSMSHAHESSGGLLEQHEAELDRLMGGSTDWKRREKLTFAAWIRPKASHNKFVNAILQMGSDTHFVFLFRAKDKLVLQSGKEPVHAGWTPICSSRFEYEMSFMLVLPEGAQGRIDLKATSSGLRDPFQNFIKDGMQIDEEMGRKLAEWARGSSVDTADLVTANERRALIEALNAAGHEQGVASEWLRLKYGVSSSKDLKRQDYEAVFRRFSDKAPLTAELVTAEPGSEG